MTVEIIIGDCREVLRAMPRESVHCVVTSPPYWSLRDYGVDGQLGLEETPSQHVRMMVKVFRAVRRVLRSDGVLWLNLGDTYIGAPHGGIGKSTSINGRPEIRAQRTAALRTHSKRGKGLKPKDMVGMPWRIALALQADGWWLRGDVIWQKPNPQPEAVTDRPTRAHEYIFQLTKSERYFYDAEAIKEPITGGAHHRGAGLGPKAIAGAGTKDEARDEAGFRPSARFGRAPGWRSRQNPSFLTSVVDLVKTRNARSVWTFPTHPFTGAHFATFPPELARLCIAAGTSEAGCCPICGAPMVRVIEKQQRTDGRPSPGERHRNQARIDAKNHQKDPPAGIRIASRTTGWVSGCEHVFDSHSRCVVLDPFAGACTTGLVADRMGRDAVMIELNAKYAEMGEGRIRDDSPLFADTKRSTR